MSFYDTNMTKAIFIKEIIDLNKWKMIYLFQQSVFRIKENYSILFNGTITRNNQNRSLYHLFRVSEMPWSPLEYTSSHVSHEAGSSRTSFSRRRWPLLLPRLDCDMDNGLAQADLLDTSFYPYCIVYFRSESDITKVFFFAALFSDRRRIIYDIGNSKLQLIFRGTAAFDKLQNLLGSSSQASIHALDWILYEQTKKRQKVTFSKTVYLYFLYIHNSLLQEIK